MHSESLNSYIATYYGKSNFPLVTPYLYCAVLRTMRLCTAMLDVLEIERKSENDVSLCGARSNARE